MLKFLINFFRLKSDDRCKKGYYSLNVGSDVAVTNALSRHFNLKVNVSF